MRTINLILACSVLAFTSLTASAAETNAVPLAEWQNRMAPAEYSILPSFRPGALPEASVGRKRTLPQRAAVAGRIEITATGARADFGAHQVQFKPNVLDADAVQLTTPEGTLLRSRILGLCYFDEDSGRAC